MNFQKRKTAILKELATAGEAEIREIAARLSVSGITIRRDLDKLASDGLLLRTRGGAIKLTSASPPFPFADKAAVNVKAKEAIARRAAEQINDGEIVFLDCGSTVFHLCQFIRTKKLRIITNSLPVIQELYDSSVDINVIGGEFNRERQATHGKMTEYHIAGYHADKAFLGVDGISPNGLFANSEKEASVTKAIATHSTMSFILCDSSKIGREAYMRFAGLDLADAVITDAQAADCQFLSNGSLTVIHA